MGVLILFVRHGTDKYRDALDELDRIYQSRAPNLTRRTIVIDNALGCGLSEELGPNQMLIGGDNTQWEFSGWQCAIDMLGNELANYDAVHLVTSAFRTLYTDYLERFSPQMIDVVARRPVATGHIDYYPYPVRFGSFVSRHWVRSSFWLINPIELIRLRKLVTVDNSEGLFSAQLERPFAEDAPLSPGYQQLIHQWLTSDQGTGQDTTWHSRFDLTAQSRSFFQEKAIAILNEHLLSIRMRAQGTHVLDMTYLAELIDRGQTMPVHFPSWRTQMSLRRIPGHEQIADALFR
jgi:hypothetical protein